MGKDKNGSETEKEENFEEKKKATIQGYEKLIERLKKEREDLKNEVDRDYREARRYVRSHPEEGVLVSFLGGVALGFILGRIGRK